MKETNKPVVAHCIRKYLSVTTNWVYSQIVNLKNYKSVVMTHKITNREMFPLDTIYNYKLSNNPIVINFQRRITHSPERYFYRCLNKENLRLLHCHFGPIAYHTLGLKRRLKIPMITMFYGHDITKIGGRWHRRYQNLFARGELFLGEGSHMCQTIEDTGCPSAKIRKLHLGVDLNKIPFRPRKLQKGEPVRVIASSTFTEKKGLPYAFEAFARAVKKYPNMTLTMIGGYTNLRHKDIYDECLWIVRRHGIGDKVKFLGYLAHNEYLKHLMASHIMLHPSITASDGDSEGGAPVTLIEASASGLPVISSQHCDIPEVIIDGESGLLVAEKDTAGLVKALLELATAPEIWPEMARLGREHISQDYDLARQVNLLESYYGEMI